MPRPRRRIALAVIVAFSLATSGCTVVKPVVGLVAGPAIILGNSNGCFCHGNPRGLGCAVALLAAAGAVAGLVTGVISDVRWLCGSPSDPCSNWADPFRINDGE